MVETLKSQRSNHTGPSSPVTSAKLAVVQLFRQTTYMATGCSPHWQMDLMCHLPESGRQVCAAPGKTYTPEAVPGQPLLFAVSPQGWVLVCSGSRNKIPQAGGLKQQQTCILSQSWSLGSPRSRCQQIHFQLRALSWLADGCHLIVCSHRERALVCLPILGRTGIPSRGPHLTSCNPNPLGSPHLQVPSHWALNIQIWRITNLRSLPAGSRNEANPPSSFAPPGEGFTLVCTHLFSAANYLLFSAPTQKQHRFSCVWGPVGWASRDLSFPFSSAAPAT